MVEADIEQVQAIERKSFHTLWSPNTYRRELRQIASSRYVVARASSTPPPPRQQSSSLAQLWHNVTQFLFCPFVPATASANDTHIVGYGGLWVTIDEGHITTIAVDPVYRGRALGELILNGLIDRAREMSTSHLTLEVRVSNTVAQNLYLKYGFQPAGTRRRYYTDNGEDALIMWTDTIHSPAYQMRLNQLRQQLFTRLRAQTQEASHLLASDETTRIYESEPRIG